MQEAKRQLSQEEKKIIKLGRANDRLNKYCIKVSLPPFVIALILILLYGFCIWKEPAVIVVGVCLILAGICIPIVWFISLTISAKKCGYTYKSYLQLVEKHGINREKIPLVDSDNVDDKKKKAQELEKKPLNKNDIIKELGDESTNSIFAILGLTFLLVTFILMFTSWEIGFWNFLIKDFIISLPIAFVFIALHRLSVSADIRAVEQDRYFIYTTKIYKKEYTDTSGVDDSPCWEYILWYMIQKHKKTLTVSELIYNSTEVGDDVFVVAIYDSKKRVKHTEIVFLSTLWTTEGSNIKYINSLPEGDK